MQDTGRIIEEIRQGNKTLREEFIASHQAFIHRYTSFICKRKLDWFNDDELSIALIAFNNALDNYENQRGRSFFAYARVLIRNSLIDFFRKQPHMPPVPLEIPEVEGATREEAISLDLYKKDMENSDRAYELHIFKGELKNFGLALARLPSYSPNHRETRESLKATAVKIASNEELIRKIYRDRRLPLKEIQAFTGVTRKNLETWRRYLLALIIIFTHPDLGIMAEYIQREEA